MTNFLNTIKIITFVIVFQVFSSCKERVIAYNGEVYEIEDKFGYNIYFKQKLFIKQENIPTVNGNISFIDSIGALKTMDLVLKKLNAGENPTITMDEIYYLNLNQPIE